MIKLYTAIGTRNYELVDGKKRMVLRSGGTVYLPNGPEAVLWHSALWTIYTARELKDVYEQQVTQAHLFPEVSFEWYLNHFEEGGFIASGMDETMEDALYDLLKSLKIMVPSATPVLLKVKAFLREVLTGTPLKRAKRIFHQPRYPGYEGLILRAAGRNTLTTAELVQWAGKDFAGDFRNTVYSGDVTPVNIGRLSRFEPTRLDVVRSVAQLYLDREIMFEKGKSVA